MQGSYPDLARKLLFIACLESGNWRVAPCVSQARISKLTRAYLKVDDKDQVNLLNSLDNGGIHMESQHIPSQDSLIPPMPIPEGARAFSQRVHGLLDGQPKDDATVAQALEGMDGMLDVIAAKFYTIASMLVGEGEESIRLVEKAIATTEVSDCHDPVHGRKLTHRALCVAALEYIAQHDPQGLAAPEHAAAKMPGNRPSCIDDDDLQSAGVSSTELERMISGPDRDRVREWLAKLPTAQRTVFALRAVSGFTTAETAELLAEHGGAEAVGWTADAVSESFRMGLCSLASQLLNAKRTGT